MLHVSQPKNNDSLLIMQELEKFCLEINLRPNGLEKYLNFSLGNKLIFYESFQFYTSQELDDELLELVKQKYLYLFEHMGSFEKFNKSKDKFYSTLIRNNISDKDDEYVKFWEVSEIKNMKHYHKFYLDFDVMYDVMLCYVVA